MILFVFYAVVIWAVAWRHRRRWAGLAVVLSGSLAVAMLTKILGATKILPFGLDFVILLYAEASLVGCVGLFIVCLPRQPAFRHCSFCFYDLRGLDGEASVCPECGVPADGYASRRRAGRSFSPGAPATAPQGSVHRSEDPG